MILLSLDDGYTSDVIISRIIHAYGFRATFFVPNYNVEGREVLSPDQIYEISQINEIGGHGVSHTYLTKLPLETAIQEISANKFYLQSIIGSQINSFCFPGGKFNNALLANATALGYKYLRTTENFHVTNSKSNIVKTSLQFYPHTRTVYIRNILRNPFCINYDIVKNAMVGSIQSRLMKIIDWSVDTGNDIHIWAHSWELFDYNLVDAFESILRYAHDSSISICSISDFYNKGGVDNA